MLENVKYSFGVNMGLGKWRMRRAVCAVVMGLLLLGALTLMAGGQTVRVNAAGAVSNVLVNGDFETGTLQGWTVVGVCNVNSSVVHGGLYSAYVSDFTSDFLPSYDNYIEQTLDLSVGSGIAFVGAIYPLKVGSLGPLDKPWSGVRLDFYFKSSMTFAFEVAYLWCWNTLYQGDNSNAFNTTRMLSFLLGFESGTWNTLSRDVTGEVYSYFAGYNFSDIVLHSVHLAYHYSNGSPGAFYADDLQVLANGTPVSTPIFSVANPADVFLLIVLVSSIGGAFCTLLILVHAGKERSKSLRNRSLRSGKAVW